MTRYVTQVHSYRTLSLLGILASASCLALLSNDLSNDNVLRQAPNENAGADRVCSWQPGRPSSLGVSYAASAHDKTSNSWLIYGGVDSAGTLAEKSSVVNTLSLGSLNDPVLSKPILANTTLLGSAAVFRTTLTDTTGIVMGGSTKILAGGSETNAVIRLSESNDGWSQRALEVDGVLEARAFASAVYIPELDVIVLIGGARDCNTESALRVPRCKESGLGTQFLKFTGSDRIEVVPGPNDGPGGTFGHAALYDPQSRSIYVIGGTRDSERTVASAFKMDLNGIDRDQLDASITWSPMSDFCNQAASVMFHQAVLMPGTSRVAIVGGVRSLKDSIEPVKSSYLIDLSAPSQGRCIDERIMPKGAIGANLAAFSTSDLLDMWMLLGGHNDSGETNTGVSKFVCEAPTPTPTSTVTATTGPSPTPTSNCRNPRLPGVYFFRESFGPPETCYYATESVPDFAFTPLNIDGVVKVSTICELPGGDWSVTMHSMKNYQPDLGIEFASCTDMPGSYPHFGQFLSARIDLIRAPTQELVSTLTPTAMPVTTSTWTPLPTITPTSTPTPSRTLTATSSPTQPTATTTATPSDTVTPSPTTTLAAVGCTDLTGAVCFCSGELFGEPCMMSRDDILDFGATQLGGPPRAVRWAPPEGWRVQLFTQTMLVPSSLCADINSPEPSIGGPCAAGVLSARLYRIVTHTPTATTPPAEVATKTETSTLTSTPSNTATPSPSPTMSPTATPTEMTCKVANNVVFWSEVIGGSCHESIVDVSNLANKGLRDGSKFVCSSPSDEWAVEVFPDVDFKPTGAGRRIEGCQPLPILARSARVNRLHKVYLPWTEGFDKNAVCFSDGSKEMEPNDDISDSGRYLVCPDERIMGRLSDDDAHQRDGRDIFALDVQRAGTIRIALDDVVDDGTVKLQGRIRGQSDPLAVGSQKRGSSRVELDMVASPFKQFMAGVARNDDVRQSSNWYSLRWSLDWLVGEREPNDWPEALHGERALGEGVPPIRGRYSSVDLQEEPLCRVPPFRDKCARGERTDYYKLELSARGVAEIRMQRPGLSCGYLKFALWNDSNQLVSPDCNSPDRYGPHFRALYSLEEGTYNVQVTHYVPSDVDCPRFSGGESALYYSLSWKVEDVSVCGGPGHGRN